MWVRIQKLIINPPKGCQGLVTSRDIAIQAGVSQSTVSRVLQGHANVSPDTRERVLRVLAETGYRPNPNAQAMRGKSTDNIGVVVGRITNPFYPELLEALSAVLEEKDKRMILWSSEGAGEAAAVQGIRDRMVDGLIFTTASSTSLALEQALISRAPIVLVNRSLAGIPCDQLTSDNFEGAAMVARHFIDLGHRKIRMLAGLPEISTGHERSTGFLTELQRLGLSIPPEHNRTCDFSHQAGKSETLRMLSEPDPPTAIFCVNDLIALGALDAALEAGVAVPEQLSIVGYDDIAMSRWSVFNLTTVRQPTRVMARDAVEMLLRRLNDPERPFEHRRFAAEFLLRQSTGPARQPGNPGLPATMVAAQRVNHPLS